MSRTLPFKVGDRFVLVSMTSDPDPVPAGTTGLITAIGMEWPDGTRVVWVEWDADRSLNLVWPLDSFTVLHDPQPES
jgi:hypothetical protein